MVNWSAFRNNSEVNGLYDVESVQSANPFGDYAILKFDDFGGTKFDNFKFGDEIKTEVEPEENPELTIQSGNTFSNSGTTTIGGTVLNSGTFSNQGTVLNQADVLSNFLGFAADINTIEQNGADKLEINAYSFDQFLRKNDVSNDQSGKTISSALEDIIKTDTPITWNASNIDVQDDRQITLSLQDERVETALLILSFKSENEGFGVNAEKEFFFRPREIKHIDRGIGPTEYFNYDIPERGRDSLNEIELRYNNGNDAVVVDDGDEKLNLEENLNLDSPGTRRQRINRPNITNAGDAESEARRILKRRNSTLTGTITTFGLFNANPFDTINVHIPDRGIDDEFIISKIEYYWARDETRLTIVENKGTDDDVIVRLSEKTERVDLRDSDADANINRVASSETEVTLSASGDFDGTSADNFKTVNKGRNLVRDGWNGKGSLNITDIAVGTENANLSRSNTTLENEVARKSVSETVNTNSVDYSASFTQTDIEEAGLFNSNGDLITRVIVDSPTDVGGTVEITLEGIDANSENAALLTDGTKAVKQIISGTGSIGVPTQFAFGTDGTKPTTSDTSLGNRQITVDIGEQPLVVVDTDSEWTNYLKNDILNSDPVEISNGELKPQKVSYFREAENGSLTGSSKFNASRYSGDSAASGAGQAIEFDGDNQLVSVDITPEYNIPQGDVAVYTRIDSPSGGAPDLDMTLNGSTWEIMPSNTVVGLVWRNSADPNLPSVTSGYGGGDLKAGTTYNLSVSSSSADSGSIYLDCLTVTDERYTSGLNFDNTLSTGANGNRYLDGPEDYPDQIVREFEAKSSPRTIQSADLNTTWNDTQNNQFLALSVDGGSNYIRKDNSTGGTFTFNQVGDTVDAKAGLSRFGTRDTETPGNGFKAQAVDFWDLNGNIEGKSPEDIGETEIRAIVDGSDIQGTTIKEAGQLDANGNLLNRVVFADIDVDSQIDNLISADSITFRPD